MLLLQIGDRGSCLNGETVLGEPVDHQLTLHGLPVRWRGFDLVSVSVE
jgi:hypothetical protein